LGIKLNLGISEEVRVHGLVLVLLVAETDGADDMLLGDAIPTFTGQQMPSGRRFKRCDMTIATLLDT